MCRWGDIEEASGLLGLEPKMVDWGMMKKLGDAEAGTRAIMMETVAQEGCEEKGARLGIGVARVISPSLPLRVCSVRSVDGSPTTAFTVLECEGSRRLGSRPRRYLLTGQANGSLAMWDLTTAMDGLGQASGTPHLPQSYPKPHGLSRNPLHNLLYHDLPTSPCPLTPVSAPNPSLPLLFTPVTASDPCPLTSASFFLGMWLAMYSL